MSVEKELDERIRRLWERIDLLQKEAQEWQERNHALRLENERLISALEAKQAKQARILEQLEVAYYVPFEIEDIENLMKIMKETE